jgi:hypothetical protein
MAAAPPRHSEAAAELRKTCRWLNEFLRKIKTDPHDRPLYRLAGRDKLVYLDRVIEALPCPSSSSRRAMARARTGRSAAPISRSSESKVERSASRYSHAVARETWSRVDLLPAIGVRKKA